MWLRVKGSRWHVEGLVIMQEHKSFLIRDLLSDVLDSKHEGNYFVILFLYIRINRGSRYLYLQNITKDVVTKNTKGFKYFVNKKG